MLFFWCENSSRIPKYSIEKQKGVVQERITAASTISGRQKKISYTFVFVSPLNGESSPYRMSLMKRYNGSGLVGGKTKIVKW